ncbi:MAG TPA: hypothetical protein VHE12_00770 [bacterium]|nr:hypothetical protein [bacterium]
MKKVIVLMFMLGAVVLNGIWFLQGCTGKIPPLSALVATSTPTLGPHVVANFDNGNATVNNNLIRSSSPNFNWLPGSISNVVVSGGANGTAFAANVFVAPTALSGYSPYELEANPNTSGNYNLSGTAYGTATNGIQFYWKTGPSDNMPARWFIVPAPEQIPPPVGNCAGGGGGCYDTYKKALSATGNTWTLVSFTWSAFAQAGWGDPKIGPLSGTCGIAPCTGSPNISRILYFQWEEDPNNVAGTYGCDFYVDEVQLF